MRLGDLDELLDRCENLYMKGHILFHGVTAYTIESSPTIAPETLPIVQELKEQLAKVTAERDAAIEDLYEVCDCETCKNTDCVPRGGTGKCRYEWKGPQEVQSD